MSNIKRRDNKGRLLLTGEYQKKDGSYTYRYTDKAGNRQVLSSWRLTKTDITPAGKKDKKPLREQEQEVQIQISKGIYDEGITVCELVDRYLITKTGVTHNTLAGYKTVQNALAKEEFGKRRIGDVKFSDAKIFLIQLQSNGRSYSSVHSIRGVLRPAFQMALEDGMINSNPFSFELGKTLINDSVKREAITKEQERKFLNFVREDKHFSRYYEGVYILFKTGLRISEFCGLTISDIDFQNHTLNIDHQLQRERDGKYVIVPTKTDAGTRVLPIKENVENCFRAILDRRGKPKAEPMVDGHAGFLYLDKNGNPLVALHWEHYFKHICDKYNKIYKVQMPKVTPHVCRHTYCTNMAKSGISVKTLQYLMGHSDIGVTMNVYTHIGLIDAREELEKMAAKETKTGAKRRKKNGDKVVNF